MTDERTRPGKETPKGVHPRRSHIRWGLVVLILLAVTVGVLVYQNIEQVPVRAFWWEFSIPLVVVIVVTAAVTLVIEALVGMIVRWRKAPARKREVPSTAG